MSLKNSISPTSPEIHLKDLVFENGISFPDRKSEDFRYAEFGLLASTPFFLQRKKPFLQEKDKNLIEEFKLAESFNLVFLDGFLNEELSDGLENSLFLTYGQELQKGKDFSVFGKKSPLNFFEALNFFYCKKGIHLEVQKSPSKNIHILWFISTKDELLPENFEIIVEKGVQLRLVFSFVSSKDSSKNFSSLTLRTLLKEKASLHFEENIYASASFYSIQHRVFQERGSSLKVKQVQLGSPYSRSSLYVALKEEEATFEAEGVSLISEKSSSDYFTFVSHQAPKTTSSQLYKSIIKDESKFVFTGEVHIAKNADTSKSSQLAQVLSFSEKARAFCRPQLDINCEEVESSHGTSIGKLPKEPFFYMQSRGISPKQAIKLFTEGFVEEVLPSFVAYDKIKKTLEEVL